MTIQGDLYQQVILEHNKKPRNFRRIAAPTNTAEGFNPLCGDHLWIDLKVNAAGVIEEATFEGSGCAISKASASMMTVELIGKTVPEAKEMFGNFHRLLTGELKLEAGAAVLGKLKIFSGIWQYPARVKCAALAWHAMANALDQSGGAVPPVSTE